MLYKQPQALVGWASFSHQLIICTDTTSRICADTTAVITCDVIGDDIVWCEIVQGRKVSSSVIQLKSPLMVRPVTLACIVVAVLYTSTMVATQ